MPKQIDLDALLGVAGEVVINGETHVVFPLDGAAFRIALRMRAGKLTEDEAFECTYEIAARCCPSLAERIDTLTLQQVTALVALAGSHVKEVEEHPKYSRPMTPLNSRENGMEGAISD